MNSTKFKRGLATLLSTAAIFAATVHPVSALALDNGGSSLANSPETAGTNAEVAAPIGGNAYYFKKSVNIGSRTFKIYAHAANNFYRIYDSFWGPHEHQKGVTETLSSSSGVTVSKETAQQFSVAMEQKASIPEVYELGTQVGYGISGMKGQAYDRSWGISLPFTDKDPYGYYKCSMLQDFGKFKVTVGSKTYYVAWPAVMKPPYSSLMYSKTGYYGTYTKYIK